MAPMGRLWNDFRGNAVVARFSRLEQSAFVATRACFFAEARLKQIVLPRNRHVADFAANLVLGDRCVVVVRKRAAVGPGRSA